MPGGHTRRRISAAEAAVIIAFIAFCGVLVWFVLRDRTPTLRIYSSLPRAELGGDPSKQTADMELAMELALKKASSGARRFKIEWIRMDDSNKAGEIDPETIATKARKAAKDSKAVVFVGDMTSGASITSIPILSTAGIPQISPGSSRVGLTVKDRFGDFDEPGVHYPSRSRTFVRLIPNDNVQAAALAALMRRDGCNRLAVVYDGGDYSDGLTNNQKAFKRPGRVFRQQVRPKADSLIYEQLAQQAKRAHADCFEYAGSSNPNTLRIFQAFARALPSAQLYATDGVNESLFTGPAARGESCVDVNLMVPPRDLAKYRKFVRDWNAANGEAPDPYAVYAYEAMRLAIDAIDSSADGKRSQILELLYDADRSDLLGDYEIYDGPDAAPGEYAITGKGDTSLVDYDVSRIRGCRAVRLERAVGRKVLARALRVLQSRAGDP